MKKLLFLLSLLAGDAFGSAGDVLNARVETNGQFLAITVSSIGTNGSFNFGAVTNYSRLISPLAKMTGASVTLQVTSPGYDTSGNAVTRTRWVYGTRQLRFTYGTGGQTNNNYVNDVTASGSDALIRMAMSDCVYSGDTIVALAVVANWYSNNNANASVTVTNSSMAAYPKVIAKWGQANYDAIRGSTYVLRVVDIDAFGMNGSMVACVQCWAKDAHGNATTNLVSKMIWDRAAGDAVPVCEHVATMDASGLTKFDVITNFYRALPWIGDPLAIADSSDGLFNSADPYWHPLYFYNAQTNVVCAVVEPTNGTSSGVVITTNLDVNNLPAAFQNCGQAANAICAVNNSKFSHNDSGNGIIYLRGATNGAFGGTSVTNSTAGPTFLVITNFPGEAATFSQKISPSKLNNKMRLCGNINFNVNSAFPFSAVSNIWLDGITINVTNSSGDMIDGAGVHWATRCVVSNLDQGLSQQGTQNTIWELIRGNWIYNGKVAPMHPYCFIGNLRDTGLSGQVLSSELSGIPRVVQTPIIAYNKFLRVTNNGSTSFSFFASIDCTNGAAFVQNVIEYIGTNGSDTVFALSGDSSTANLTNVNCIANTFLGGKANTEYNDNGSNAVTRVNCRDIGNVYGDGNRKSDTHNGGSHGPDGARTGNWGPYWSVGSYGNCWLEYSVELPVSASGQFINEFAGLGGYQPAISVEAEPSGASNVWGFPKFINDQNYDGTNTVGHGDYHVHPSSPAHWARSGMWMLPADLDGRPRSTMDPAGAYASSGYRVTGGFFQ